MGHMLPKINLILIW